ncbi:MAG: Fic family protein [Bacteroidales bacterium]
MNYISVSEFAKIHDLSERTVRNQCALGKIEGAFITGKTWSIPSEATPPMLKKKRVAISPLLKRLREEKEMNLKGGIYHKTQIDLTYNSNHIEGSRLTHEQTRYIFETNTIGITTESVNIDDIIETANHFRCIDIIIERAVDPLSEDLIKELHRTLKSGTSDSKKSWFVVGDYKKLPNEVGGNETTSPAKVSQEMKQLLKAYNSLRCKSFEDIIEFHHNFEAIHPFQDGNGRVGRLIIFKECLATSEVPFIINDELKMFYHRGLQQWGNQRGYLLDTCLSAQDDYKAFLDYFEIKY